FLNPVEQALPEASDVVAGVCGSKYAPLFKSVWGDGVCSDVAEAYDAIAFSVAAYERSPEVSPFSAKYDAYVSGQAKLTEQEALGEKLFNGKAMCANCHMPPLFTDFTYDNLGLPRNPVNPFYTQDEFNPDGWDWVDPGLGGFL